MIDPQQASAPVAAAAPTQAPVIPPQVNVAQGLPPFYCYPSAPENAGYPAQPAVAPVQAPYPYPPQYPQAQAQYPQQPAVAAANPAPAPTYPNYPNAAYPAHCHPHHHAAYYPPVPPYAAQPYPPQYPQAAYPQQGQYPYPPHLAPYYAAYAAQAAAATSAPQNHEQGFASFFNFKDEKFLKGAITGAALTFILTNESLQKNTIKSLVKLWNTLQGGIEEVKERFQDAEAEIKAEQQSK